MQGDLPRGNAAWRRNAEMKRSPMHRRGARTAPDMQTLWKWHWLNPEQSPSLPIYPCVVIQGKWHLQDFKVGRQMQPLIRGSSDQNFWVKLDFQTQVGGIWLLPFVWHCWGTSAVVCLFWGSPLWDTWVYWSKGSPRHVEIGVYMHNRRLRKPGLFGLEEKMLTYISLLPVADKWEAEKKSARLFLELCTLGEGATNTYWSMGNTN